MHAFSKFKFAKRVFLLLSEKIGISYKARISRKVKSFLIFASGTCTAGEKVIT